MKKQKFEVGEKICAYRGYDRCVGFVEKIYKNSDVLKLKRYDYYFNFKQCRRLVKKKKHVEPASIKLFEGCYGKDRTGKVHGPMRTIKLEHNCTPYKFEVDNFAWTRDGISYPSAGPMPSDIIELVEAPKPVEKRAAREWWIVISGDGYNAAFSSKKDAEHFRNNNYPEFEIKYAREVLDEPSEEKQAYIDSAKNMNPEGQ